MSEKTIKFKEDVKPPYNGKIKAPTRIADTRDTWYIIINDGEKDGPYTTEDMRGFFEADIFEDDTLCTNEGIDGNYYKMGHIFYPNILDAFQPNDYNPLVNLDRRTAAATAEISRLAEKQEWNLAAGGVAVNQLPSTDTDPVEGDEELKWFLHHGNPKWVNKKGEIVKFGESVRRDFIMIGDVMTMFEFRKMDPLRFSHKGDGILRIKMNEKECAINGMQTTVCVKEMMIFTINGILYKLYPVINGSKRYLIMCNGPEVVEVIFFAGSEPTTLPQTSVVSDSVDSRQIPSYADLSQMKYRSVSELLGFNDETMKKVCIFSENIHVRRSLLSVVYDRDSIFTILTQGKYWKFTYWENNRQIYIVFTPEGHIKHESGEITGSWSIKKEGSFALYQDNRDWSTIYRQRIKYRVRLEMVGGAKHNMYVLKDTTTSIFYLQEELAYFKIVDGAVTMADISGRKSCDAFRVV